MGVSLLSFRIFIKQLPREGLFVFLWGTVTARGIIAVYCVDLIYGDLDLILFIGKIGAGGFVIVLCFFVPYVVGIYGDRFGFGLFGSGDGGCSFGDGIFLSARG